MTHAALQQLLDSELGGATPAAVQALAAQLAQRGGDATCAVLYYGSALRAESLEGVLDFYVLLDTVGAWPGSLMAKTANRLLPPNVGYLESTVEGQVLRAKYAVLSVAQFNRKLGEGALDTTIWARFCQPALCVWARTPQDRANVTASISTAVTTAALWAVKLGPATAAPGDFWRALFARTYAAELRVEKSGRPQDIIGKNPERYADLLPLALQASGVSFAITARGELAPGLDMAQRERARRRWRWRDRLGRPLNILRLLKAAFTFDGAMDYVAWKIERHRGVRIEIAPWQRRFPLLAAPGLYWQLRRRGILR